MKKIRITTLPEGPMPEDMRKALVGLIIDVDEGAIARTVGRQNVNDPNHYMMPSDVVAALVKVGRMREADFWKKNMGRIFSLKKTDCEVIET